jgi:hypothetical protein
MKSENHRHLATFHDKDLADHLDDIAKEDAGSEAAKEWAAKQGAAFQAKAKEEAGKIGPQAAGKLTADHLKAGDVIETAKGNKGTVFWKPGSAANSASRVVFPSP